MLKPKPLPTITLIRDWINQDGITKYIRDWINQDGITKYILVYIISGSFEGEHT